jgi:hypothetical protein
MRLLVEQVSNIRLWPSPRVDIGATKKPSQNVMPQQGHCVSD